MTIRSIDTSPGVDAMAAHFVVPGKVAWLSHSRPALNRLIASKRGNVLPIVAASILPMAAMIGGAVDMSRAYMVKSRIQQACDAGVLAGRRAMQQSNYSEAAKAQAQDFFDINFKEGYNDTTDVSFVTTNPSGTSKVLGTASTIMPTAIMGMFGKETIPIDVACEAELNLSNSDVTFVLDVTGSMNDSIPVGGGGSIVKITALRNSVMSFYDTLANAATGSLARIRYGFVPYSTNVNVGEILYDTNQTWMNGGNTADSWNYQSRRAIWRTTAVDCQVFGGNQSFSCPTRNHSTVSGGGTNISLQNCVNYGDNRGGWGYGFNPNPSGTPIESTSGGLTTKTSYTAYSWGGRASGWSDYNDKQCVRQRTVETESTTQEPGSTFVRWEYMQRTYPTYDFVRSIKTANPAVLTPSEINNSTSRWAGCIEERDTIAGSVIAYGSNGITVDGSTNAHDLNIDAAPSSDATKWRPYWEQVYFQRNGSRSTACPSKARLLSTMARTEVQSYVNSLVAVGGTYHDVGLLWGARIASPQGIFASNVNASPGNGGSVGRHVIFMTDGELTSYDFVASMYGTESLDRRVTGGSNNPTQLERQRRRYLAICEAIKGKGIRLWVIAFGTTLTNDLQTCASTGSAYTAANSTALNTAFQNIAKQISELRLTK
ncbi:pilus assembly protein [Blastomonas aquatica]|uniref:Pilus assembly protein TadG n=1 Tax=Blastomonas aquatica TaxID=1510276 RepID=A0ABQ1J8W2_9SPHN|nr:TadE/TadG family type IV pilus assembly protein [Blastomonas aquatica]GGB60591.1 pilus assembly protein TadG [Blastomonas aquatica]